MTADATRLRLRVAPRASRSAVVGRHGAAWKVRLVAAPERGRANEEAISLVAEVAGVERGRVRLLAGASSRDKVVAVEGVAAEELDRRFAARSESG